MAIGPHKDSTREDLVPVLDPIEQELKVKMESENEEEAELIAFLVASGCTLLCVGVLVWVMCAMSSDNSSDG